MQELGKMMARDLQADERLLTEVRSILQGSLATQTLSSLHLRACVAQSLLSLMAEVISDHPKMKSFVRELQAKEGEYMPSYPPMSPVTRSYFNLWLTCDYRISQGQTVSTLVSWFTKKLEIPTEVASDCALLGKSRMGFYRVSEVSLSTVRAAEIPFGRIVEFENQSGYTPKSGEVLFLRLFESLPVGVCATTPYVIGGQTKESDIVSFFERHKVAAKDYDSFMKRPKETYIWHEYIMNGYTGHTEGAIFLSGVPDIEETLPHSTRYVSKEEAS